MQSNNNQQASQRSDAPASSIAMAIALPGRFIVRPNRQGATQIASKQSCSLQPRWEPSNQQYLQPNPIRVQCAQQIPTRANSYQGMVSGQRTAASAVPAQFARPRALVPPPGAAPLQVGYSTHIISFVSTVNTLQVCVLQMSKKSGLPCL